MRSSASGRRVARGSTRTWRIIRSAFAVGRDPVPFCRAISDGTVDYLTRRGVALSGAHVLDAGTGSGAIPEALASIGARPIGLDVADHRARGIEATPFVLGRTERLPFADQTFDVVISSNVLEHVPDPWTVIGELVRVARTEGFVYLSWTNWLSPIGGHEMSPFHYLGAERGLRAYERIRGTRPPGNVPGIGLHPVHIGSVLRGLSTSGLLIRDVAPRYWPWLRSVSRVPGLREVAMWNCVILVQRPVTPWSVERARATRA